MRKPTSSHRDIAILMLIEASGPRRALIAQALSRLREVLPDGTVLGVRWTAAVRATRKDLSEVGVFAALRARNPDDMQRLRKLIYAALSELTKTPAMPMQPQEPPGAFFAPLPEDPPGELVVEIFYRGGEVQEMGQNGLP